MPTMTGDHENRITDYTSVICEPVRGGTFALTVGSYMQVNEERTATLMARDFKDPQCVAYAMQSFGEYEEREVASALKQRDYKDATDLIAEVTPPGSGARYIVRRLTPLECERLQGYPDGWTDIGAWTDTKGREHKESTDSARYKALGNSIALPPWVYVLMRLSACCEGDWTMASLFDGIGGFPLIWETLNGRGTCLWASEIEEFPIAVTKRRIGDEGEDVPVAAETDNSDGRTEAADQGASGLSDSRACW